MDRDDRSVRIWIALRAGAKAVIAGAVGGAIAGALIVIIPAHGYDPVASVAAIFGSLFGIVAFPVCYFALVRDVPMWLVFVCAIPATIAAEIGFIHYLGNRDVPSGGFLFDFFAGGFAGLLAACVVLRIVYSSKLVGASRSSISRAGRP